MIGTTCLHHLQRPLAREYPQVLRRFELWLLIEIVEQLAKDCGVLLFNVGKTMQ